MTGGLRRKLIRMFRNMRSVGVFMSLVGQARIFGSSTPQVQHRAMSFLHMFVSTLVLPESAGVLDTSAISQEHFSYCGLEMLR